MTLSVSPRTRQLILLVNRFVFFFTRHWLSLTIFFLAIFTGLPFLPPVLEHYGFDVAAQKIYWVYGFTCHQLAYRSFFFFGDANAYTVDQLASALRVSEPAGNLFFWHSIIGDSELGYKMAWCERDTAMYVSMIVGLLFFAAMRRHLRPLDPFLYVLFLVPMAIDGVWQLFTSPLTILAFLPTHESTPELRILTGGLFGIATVWLIFPRVETAMRDTLAQTQAQFDRAQAKNFP